MLSLKSPYVTLNINDIFNRPIIHISKDRFLAWGRQQTISLVKSFLFCHCFIGTDVLVARCYHLDIEIQPK